MIKPTSILFFCVALAFSLATCNAQESQGVEGSNVHKSPETLFAEFAGIYNSGEGDFLPLLSKKTKALGLFLRVLLFRNGLHRTEGSLLCVEREMGS